MKINLPKTKFMVFHPGKTKDFLPQFEIEDTPIELMEQTKLLGVIVDSNLSWTSNTEFIVSRCNSFNRRGHCQVGEDPENLPAYPFG